MRYTFISLFLALSVSTGAEAQEIIKPGLKSATSFAIIIDKASYAKARSAVDGYRRSIEDDGLGTYIAIDDWKSPEEIRRLLREWHSDRRQPLEGAVFVGDIPIPMIRDAQYLTSAFKMSQKRSWQASSVPSDRYYDDFSLQFGFIRKDADRSDLFYYTLLPESAQTIAPDIYTARIRPPKRKGADRYRLLADYLEKVVRIKAEEAHGNLLDNLTMARGHGYNSEDPNAWAGEQLALREQMPQLFRPGATARFMSFEMYYPVRKLYVNEVCRDNLDVMLFHHHGAPDTQYLNGYPECSAIGPSIDNVKRFLRSKIGRYAGKDCRDSIVAVYAQRYDVPEKWCREAFDADLQAKDSIFNAEMDLHLEDFRNVHPNARFVWFDACYNGSFHEDDCIADAYIFNSGKTVATMGNTVNSLQDKWPDEFVGLLASGMRLGQFCRHTAYLETHLIGDPTYRFKADSGLAFDINAALTLHDKDAKFWLKQLENPVADVQAMALRQLWLARYPKAADVMENAYFTSDCFVVRLEAMRILALHYPESSMGVLKAALNDNYELTRRIAIKLVEGNGNPELLPALISGYLSRWYEIRYSFKTLEALVAFDPEAAKAELHRQTATMSCYDDAFIRKMEAKLASWARDFQETKQAMHDRDLKPSKRLSAILKLRNYPDGRLVGDLLSLVSDDHEDMEVRCNAANVLGWFDTWYGKARIIEALRTMKVADQALQGEISRALNRLTR